MQKNPFRSINQDVNRQELPPEELRSRFETFITNRKRVTRLAFVQSIFLYSAMQENGEFEGKTLQATSRNILVTIVNFYKTVFYVGRYGDTRKTQKLDEKFLHSVIQNTIESITEIDMKIQQYLKTPWQVSALDKTVASILRCGVYELMFNSKVGGKIIASEYTNIAHAFFDGPEIGFVNAILDKISQNV